VKNLLKFGKIAQILWFIIKFAYRRGEIFDKNLYSKKKNNILTNYLLVSFFIHVHKFTRTRERGILSIG